MAAPVDAPHPTPSNSYPVPVLYTYDLLHSSDDDVGGAQARRDIIRAKLGAVASEARMEVTHTREGVKVGGRMYKTPQPTHLMKLLRL